MVIMISNHCTFKRSARDRDLIVVPDTDFRVTCSTDMDSRMACSNKYGFFINCVQLQLTPILA